MLRASSASIPLPERYRVTGRIAAGGMAEVWAAHDEVLDRPVAVKVLALHLSADPTARRRFEREARAAAGLSSHPSVVTIFDVGEADGRSFIVMELRDGGTLADVIRAGRPVAPAKALSWLREVADALDAAHERGIVHRDIKPANLLLDQRGHLAVADFGIARLAWETTQMTATGQVLGTAAYLSPEQALGEPATAASDRYALAVVAYELLTGSRLFPHAEHFTAQARAHIEDAPVPPSERNEKLAVAVDHVVLRGLAKDPAKRWSTATVMIDALASALGGKAAAATPTAMPWADATAVTAKLASGVAAAGAGAVAGVSRTLQTLRTQADGVRNQAQAPVAPAAPRQRRISAETRRRTRVLPVAALILAAVTIIALASSSGGGSGRGTRSPDPAPPPAAPQPAPPTPAPAAPSGTPAQLNNRGYVLFQQDRYKEALPLFKAAVRGCGSSRALDPCGYALYNLGASLHRSGRSREAIAILVRRLRRFGDNESRDVRRELAAAIRASRHG